MRKDLVQRRNREIVIGEMKKLNEDISKCVSFFDFFAKTIPIRNSNLQL